jgi:hypothetical protein
VKLIRDRNGKGEIQKIEEKLIELLCCTKALIYDGIYTQKWEAKFGSMASASP